jgi:6-pyruvoyltetrahydropterin/6-carboxytetrahydropterin synthase
MFLLTREVRFTTNPSGLGDFYRLAVTLAGQPASPTEYVVDIKQIDAAVRNHAFDLLGDHPTAVGRLMLGLFDRLNTSWPTGVRLQSLSLHASPLLSFSAIGSELPMLRLSQKFEFSAAHRLHNPKLSDDENRRLFGKCNNPHGHGHNYELQVTLLGEPAKDGSLIDVPAMQKIVGQTVLDRFDHRNLNTEVAEFRELIPTVENIAMTIYRLLKPNLTSAGLKLGSVTVWETPKTWCEYTE